MTNIDEEFDNLKRLVKMIASQFGHRCEVVLHDLRKDYNHTIVAIENNHITSRNVGDCGSNLGLEVLRGKSNKGDTYNYITRLKDGKLVRSSSMYFRDNQNNVIGALCINYDISDLLWVKNVIKDLTGLEENDRNVNETFVNNVNELIDLFIQEWEEKIGKPASLLSKDEKIAAVEFLDNKGTFLITKSGDAICDYLNISKYTLYNYLDIVRKKDNA